MQAITNSLKNTVRAFAGTRFHFRITSAETNGALSVIDVFMRPGSEPPRHVHSNEDEANIIHSGEIHCFIGDEIITAKKGDVVFLPKGIPHYFKVMSPTASVTLILTPGGFEEFFEAVTFDFNGDDVPSVADRSLIEDRKRRVQQYSAQFGVCFV